MGLMCWDKWTSGQVRHIVSNIRALQRIVNVDKYGQVTRISGQVTPLTYINPRNTPRITLTEGGQVTTELDHSTGYYVIRRPDHRDHDLLVGHRVHVQTLLEACAIAYSLSKQLHPYFCMSVNDYAGCYYASYSNGVETTHHDRRMTDERG